jgi:hypothetical protein
MTLGLVMIVRDEEAVIERALRSAIPWIQTYVIVDTGSTDKTKEVIARVMEEAKIEGIVVDRPWVNFGHNRTEALELCRSRMEWALMLDADDNLCDRAPPTPKLFDRTDLDALAVRIHHGDLEHNRLQLFRVAADWAYQGVVHEIPVCRSTKEPKVGMLPLEYWMETRCAGVRSRDPQKYIKDAMLLEKEYAKSPEDMRTLYYIAQSYRDAERPRDASHYYRRYVDRGITNPTSTNAQELYIAMMNLIILSDAPDEQLRVAWAAMELCPTRLEAGYALMRSWRLAGRKPVQQIYALAAACSSREYQSAWPYVNPDVYAWGYDEEFAVLAHSTGHHQEAYDAFMRCAVKGPTAAFRENIVKNAKIVEGHLRPKHG